MTTADLVAVFTEVYCGFREVGGLDAVVPILGFKDMMERRMSPAPADGAGANAAPRFTDEEYFAISGPLINKLLAADALVHALENPDPSLSACQKKNLWLKQQMDTAFRMIAEPILESELSKYGPLARPFVRNTIVKKVSKLVRDCFREASAMLPGIASTMSVDEAYGWLRGQSTRCLPEPVRPPPPRRPPPSTTNYRPRRNWQRWDSCERARSSR